MRATPRPPARVPRQKRSRETVRAIVEATRRLLASRESVEMTRVAKVAGVSVGTLYEYFPSKDPLIKAVEASAWESQLSVLPSTLLAIEAGRSLEQVIGELVGVGVSFIAESGALHGVSLDSPTAREAREPLLEALVAFFATRIEPHRDQVRLADVSSALRFAIQTVFNLTGVAVQTRDPMLASGELQERLADLVVRYLVAS
jgi:AcrR family transcriptional regulator